MKRCFFLRFPISACSNSTWQESIMWSWRSWTAVFRFTSVAALSTTFSWSVPAHHVNQAQTSKARDTRRPLSTCRGPGGDYPLQESRTQHEKRANAAHHWPAIDYLWRHPSLTRPYPIACFIMYIFICSTPPVSDKQMQTLSSNSRAKVPTQVWWQTIPVVICPLPVYRYRPGAMHPRSPAHIIPHPSHCPRPPIHFWPTYFLCNWT